MTRRAFLAGAGSTLLLAAGAENSSGDTGTSGVVADRAAREIRIRGTVHPHAMGMPFGVRGHHAVVWKDGGSARWALVKSAASDSEVRRALESLGARAGENLVPETWTERTNRERPEPSMRVTGPRVEVLLSWRGSGGAITLSELIVQERAKAPELRFRYGGNERWQPQFRSGCIVCLYSCPGGAIGNELRTIRDYENEGVIFTANRKRLPRSGAHVTIHLRLLQEDAP